MPEATNGAVGVQITTAKTLDELEPLRVLWAELLGPQLNADLDYFSTTVRSREQAARPHVVLLERGGQPRALAVGRVEDITLPCKVGYKNVYTPRVRALTVVYGGVLGNPSEEDARLLFAELRAALSRGDADVLRLRNLEVGSLLHRLATRVPPFLARQHVSTKSVHWELTLPATLDELLESKSSSFRKGIRYDERRLTREFGDRLSLEVFRGPENVDRLFQEIAEVTATTYQHGLGVAFGDRELDRALTQLAAEREWLRAYVLSIDGRPCAFWHGVAHRGRFNLGTPGYDPAYAHLRIGNYLLLRVLEDLCEDPSVETFDFGFGDAFYKQRLGDSSRLEEDVLVYAPSFRGARVNLTRTAVLKTAGVARQAAERAPLRGLKRRWRGRLSARVGVEAAMRSPRVPWRIAVLVALASSLLAGSLLGLAALDRPATTAHEEMIVQAPRHVVWRLLSDFDGYDSWNPFITEASGDARPGETVSMHLRPRGEKALDAECEVLVVKRLRKLRWRCRTYAPGLLDREHTFRVLPLGPDRVLVRYDGRWEGLLQPFEDLSARKRGYESMTRALKQHAERST